MDTNGTDGRPLRLASAAATLTPAALVARLALAAAHLRDHQHHGADTHAHETETIFAGPQRCTVVCHCCRVEISCRNAAEAIRTAAEHRRTSVRTVVAAA